LRGRWAFRSIPVRRYRRQPIASGHQVRLRAQRLTASWRAEARGLYAGAAAGNAVVVQRLLVNQGLRVSVRTVERAVADLRQARRVAQLATVRVETAPGEQMQVDFGQQWVLIAGAAVRIFLLVAVLSYSRRLFVKAFLSERQADWREGSPPPSSTSGAYRRCCSAITRGRWSAGAIGRPERWSFSQPILILAGIGRCSRGRARRIGPAPRGKRRRA
jgi:hypothetical protein